MTRFGGRQQKLLGAIFLLTGCAGAAFAWKSENDVAVTLAALVALGGLFWSTAGFLADRGDAAAADVEIIGIADRLADQLRQQWSAEAKHRDLNRPPLAVSWRPAHRSMVQSWSYLERLAKEGAGWRISAHTATGPDELSGTGRLMDTVDKVPTGRLVVLGPPGAGKTVLLVRLALDLIARRNQGDPVPMLVPLAGWDTQRDFYAWLESQIIRQHPWLATRAVAGGSRARALIAGGLVLPILDGLDEIQIESRKNAIKVINETLIEGRGIILSCRTEEFGKAVGANKNRQEFLEGAAGIQLRPLNPNEVVRYLIETSGGNEAAVIRWRAVEAALRTRPLPPVAKSLSTPLTATLARTVFNPRRYGGSVSGLPDPSQLCDTTKFRTRASIENYLLDGFIGAAYRPHPGRENRWKVQYAERYLKFLATHLERQVHRTTLSWWELPFSVPKFYRAIAFGPIMGIMVLSPQGFIAGFALGYFVVPKRSPLPRRFAKKPKAVDLVIGIALGLAVTLTWWPAVGRLSLVIGLALAFSTTFGFGSGVDLRQSLDPQTLLFQDKVRSIVGGLWYGGTLGVAIAFAEKTLNKISTLNPNNTVQGIVAGLSFAAIYVLMSPWGQFCFARIYFCATRVQPLRLVAFIDEAYERGVLRRNGAVWEFRHVSLQRRLAK